MPKPSAELRQIAKALREEFAKFSILRPNNLAVDKAIKIIEKSFSGSWRGYHSRVYYENFAPVPKGASFNPEWGLFLPAEFARSVATASKGNWVEFSHEEIYSKIAQLACVPNPSEDAGLAAFEAFNSGKSDVVSILTVQRNHHWDRRLDDLEDAVESLKLETAQEIASKKAPTGQFLCRDQRALAEGELIPPHELVAARLVVISSTFKLCEDLAKVAEDIAKHLDRIGSRDGREVGAKVFIGHGGSPAWRALKEFLQDRLNLEVVEFNSSVAAGMTITERLSVMLDSSSFAFLVMTGEDETLDGSLQARLNVIHEMGLFQGRLGFKRAIVLLEDGCAEFSNIHGLSQIRFPKGDIQAKSEEIRRVLEREGVIGTETT